MVINEPQSLLLQVNTLTEHYRKNNALNGDSFNIFRILKVESSEVRLHSAFLASLLNPKESHGQKDAFLKLFLKYFGFKEQGFNSDNCKVEVEKHIGFTTKDGTTGGRIDIALTDDQGRQILIENSIYAGDQNNLLQRYYHYSPEAELFYLTLGGKMPAEHSCAELESNKHFKCLSYKSDILNWLEECQKEATILPIVKEAIAQYINLIKYLTNQTADNSLQKELDQLIKANLESAFIISNGLDLATKTIFEEFSESIEELCRKFGLACSNKLNLDENYSGVWMGKKEWQHVNIGFQFQNLNKGLVYGFVVKNNPENTEIPPDLEIGLKQISGNSTKPNGWWPWYRKFEEPYGDWSKHHAWKAILNGNMLNAMKEKIEYLLDSTSHLTL
jgi:hypothetical protein